MEMAAEEIKIACPHCGQHILIESSMLGTELQCPTCNQSFTTPAADTDESEGIATGETAETNVSANNDAASPENIAAEPFETEAAETSADKPTTKGRNAVILAGRFVSEVKHIVVKAYTRTRKWFSTLSKRNRRIVAAALVLLVLFALFGLSGGDRENRRNEEFAKKQRERGLVLVQGRWATPGSRFDIPLTVLQKLLNEGITMRRGPMDGEHGGLLCVDANNEVGCIIVSERQWHFVQEGEKLTFDIFRCGSYTYPTRNGQMNTIRLFATELETALEEMKSGKHSERFK